MPRSWKERELRDGATPRLALHPARCGAVRLRPGQELKAALVEVARASGMTACGVVTCVGSVTAARLRLANADRDHPNEVVELPPDGAEMRYEVVSLVGTLGPGGSHLHVSLSDKDGRTVGGHLMSATVFTTCEVVLCDIPALTFDRVFDEETGFDELRVVASASAGSGGPGGDA